MEILRTARGLIYLAALFLPQLTEAQSYTPAKPYGETKLVNDFICSEMVYPDKALENKQEGDVVLGFRVGADGMVANIHVNKGVSPEIDREAIRIFRLLQWEPAIRLGNPVSSEDVYTFKFNIKKYNRQCKQRGYEKTEYPPLPIDTSLIVYDVKQVDKAPTPVFDQQGMTLGKFITQNLVYPEAAYKQNISGKVVLSFVVEAHGRPSNILIEEPVGGGCTEEALRIMRLIQWMPAMKGDRIVRCRVSLNIIFKLPSDTDHKLFDNNQGAI